MKSKSHDKAAGNKKEGVSKYGTPSFYSGIPQFPDTLLLA
jgi:hypothetical protein